MEKSESVKKQTGKKLMLSNFKVKKKTLEEYKFDLKKKNQKKSRKNSEFFNIKEDYYLLISDIIFPFPHFGYKNLSLFLKDFAKRTKRSFKSV